MLSCFHLLIARCRFTLAFLFGSATSNEDEDKREEEEDEEEEDEEREGITTISAPAASKLAKRCSFVVGVADFSVGDGLSSGSDSDEGEDEEEEEGEEEGDDDEEEDACCVGIIGS